MESLFMHHKIAESLLGEFPDQADTTKLKKVRESEKAMLIKSRLGLIPITFWIPKYWAERPIKYWGLIRESFSKSVKEAKDTGIFLEFKGIVRIDNYLMSGHGAVLLEIQEGEGAKVILKDIGGIGFRLSIPKYLIDNTYYWPKLYCHNTLINALHRSTEERRKLTQLFWTSLVADTNYKGDCKKNSDLSMFELN